MKVIDIVAVATVAIMCCAAVYRILCMPFNGQPKSRKDKQDEGK